MPMIPQFTADQTPLVGAPSGGQIDPGIAGKPGADLARAAGEQVSMWEQWEQRYADARRQADAANRAAGVTKALGEAQFRWSKTPDRAAAMAGFESDAARIRSQALDGVDDPLIQAYIVKHATTETVARGLDTGNAAFRLESSMRRGDLDTNLATFAHSAATATNEDLRAAITDTAVGSIKSSVRAGWLDPEAGAKEVIRFKSRIDEVKARGLLTADPNAAIRALSTPGFLPDLDEKTRASLLDMSVRRSIAQTEHADRAADRALRKQEEDVAKTGFGLIADGSLTREWIDRNRGTLSKADYAGFLKALEPGTATDDKDTIIDLRTRLDTEDISGEATRAFRLGQITQSSWKDLLEKNRTALKDDQPASSYKSARELVKGTLDPGLLTGPGQTVLRAAREQALVEFDNWSQVNLKASRYDTINQAQDIIKRYQQISYDKLSVATGLPMFYAGTRNLLGMADIDNAEKRTLDALATGQITQEQAALEGRKIETWRFALEQKAAADAAAAKGKKK